MQSSQCYNIIQNYYTFQMKNSNLRKSKRNAKISVSKRKKLIFFVTEKFYSIGKAAARLKLKLSTAKMIVKRFREEGTFFEPKLFELKRNKASCDKQKVEEEMEEISEELAVKIEELQSKNLILEVKVQERECPTFISGDECPSQPSLPSWTFIYAQPPHFFEGYMIRSCPSLLPSFYPA